MFELKKYSKYLMWIIYVETLFRYLLFMGSLSV